MTTSWQEIIAPDEDIRFKRYAAEIRAMQQKNARAGGVSRALHAKANAGVVGRLAVQTTDEKLRVGVFAESRAWPVYVRFSNGAGAHQSDGVPDVRGLAIKLVGVPGTKIIAGMEDAPTQDLLFIHTPSFPVRSPDEFILLLRASARGRLLLLPRLVSALGFARAVTILRGLLAVPKVLSMATQPFYSGAAIRIGDTAVRLSLVPDATDAPRGHGREALRDDLVARLKTADVTYTLYAQSFVDEARTPIEDASVPWTEANAPRSTLARLVIPRQDVNSARGQEIARTVESLSFDPWHALEVHRPLGAIMRARAAAYRESVLARGASPEPDAVLDPA